MKRYVCWLALLGVGAVPDWASAFGRRYSCGPAYYEPMYYAPPPVHYAPACVPVYIAPPCPPAAAASPKATARAPRPADPPRPMPETVTPAAAVNPAPRTPAPREDVDFRPSAPPASPPKLEVPKFETKSPGLDVPPAPAGGLTLPPIPAPDAAPLIPAPVPPLSPEPKKTDSLPPLVLPPESPVKPSTSRSSPVGKLTASVYEATGAGVRTSDGLKKVVFFNHTDRDLNLTVDGKTVKLPARSYVDARLGALFRWKHADGEEVAATIPADAAGLDVVFKE